MFACIFDSEGKLKRKCPDFSEVKRTSSALRQDPPSKSEPSRERLSIHRRCLRGATPARSRDPRVLRLEKMWPKYLDLSEEECLGILRKLGNYIF